MKKSLTNILAIIGAIDTVIAVKGAVDKYILKKKPKAQEIEIFWEESMRKHSETKFSERFSGVSTSAKLDGKTKDKNGVFRTKAGIIRIMDVIKYLKSEGYLENVHIDDPEEKKPAGSCEGKGDTEE